MRVLFLCTAHNSLSQRLFLELSSLGHDVSIEYAISDEIMQSAVSLFGPDLVICPFLTTRVPKEIYNRVLTLIIHPGPPGDAGPSALDWLLMGDDGSVDGTGQALAKLSTDSVTHGRSHWGVTILQAIEDFDAGPVWAFEQFPVDIDEPGLTKSELYRGSVTRAAVTATKAAIARLQQAVRGRRMSVLVKKSTSFMPSLHADPSYAVLSVTARLPFQGGRTCHRPLLKAVHREFDVKRHTAGQISRRIRSADSQPGVLSKVFGVSLYVYGGRVEEHAIPYASITIPGTATQIVEVRNQAVCFATCDGKGIWISHVRKPKGERDALQPKVPATLCLLELGILAAAQIDGLQTPRPRCDWTLRPYGTLQDIWVDIVVDENQNKTAYLYWDFYNGAMATDQCSRLIEAMDHILSESTLASPIHAVALMGGSYFCNGIALNVAEQAADSALESWLNINRINDVVHHVLYEFPSRGILTIAAMRGNVAAGGVALAASCDFVIAGAEIVLNPAYRAIGLYGSEYHTLSYYARCGKDVAEKVLRSMQPLSPFQAQRIGLVDYVFPGVGAELEDCIRAHISLLLKPCCLKRGFWKANADLSPSSLAQIRTLELAEMSKDFWSSRSIRYHCRRSDFVRKVKPTRTPLRFAKHRRLCDNSERDEEDTDQFDDVEYFKKSTADAMLIECRNRVLEEINASHRLSAVVFTPLDNAESTKNDAQEREMETLFSCYYKPTPAEPMDGLLTPPETPFEAHVAGPFFGRPENLEGKARWEVSAMGEGQSDCFGKSTEFRISHVVDVA